MQAKEINRQIRTVILVVGLIIVVVALITTRNDFAEQRRIAAFTSTPQVATQAFASANETRAALGSPTVPPANTPEPYETLVQLQLEGTFGPSQTPLPTHTPQPTHTRLPTNTPEPTRTPGPTWTPQPTWTSVPGVLTLAFDGLNDILATENVATRTPAATLISREELAETVIAKTLAYTWRITITPTPTPTDTPTPVPTNEIELAPTLAG